MLLNGCLNKALAGIDISTLRKWALIRHGVHKGAGCLTRHGPDLGAPGGGIALLQVHQAQPLRQEGGVRARQVPRVRVEVRAYIGRARGALLDGLFWCAHEG